MKTNLGSLPFVVKHPTGPCDDITMKTAEMDGSRRHLENPFTIAFKLCR